MTICQPVDSCACCGRWTVGAGQTIPLIIDWSTWLDSLSGFALRTITKAELSSFNGPAPAPADPAEIALVSGLAVDPTIPPALPGWRSIVAAGQATQNLIRVAPDVPIGSLYRLDIVAEAKDCDGRALALPYCVAINVTAC